MAFGGAGKQILGSTLSFVKGYIPWVGPWPPYHTFEGKGSGLLGCGTAEAFSVVVWQHMCTINLKLFLLQNIFVASLYYGELRDMHNPCGKAQKARVALQSIYDRYLRHICGVKYATPSASGVRIVATAGFLVATNT